MLRTKFDTVPDKDFDGRVQEIEKDFRKQLDAVIKDAEFDNQKAALTANWLKQNMATLVHLAVSSGQDVDLKTTIPDFDKVKAEPTRDTYDFKLIQTAKFAGLMRSAPGSVPGNGSAAIWPRSAEAFSPIWQEKVASF